jgi:serine/threonine protein kinase
MSEDEPRTVWQRDPRDKRPTVHREDPPTVLQPPVPSSGQAGGRSPRARSWRGGVDRADDRDPLTVKQAPATSPDPATWFQPVPGGGRPGPMGGVLPAPLSGRFTLTEGPGGSTRLGSGAEADVWLAHDADHGCPVALKIYKPQPGADPEAVLDTRLRTRLNDDAFRRHVPRLYGWGWVDDGYGTQVAWEAMEYFPAGSLADLMAREVGAGRPLPPARIRHVIAALVDALEFWEDVVHHRQIDLSPGNILVRDEQPLTLVLSDFGGVRGTGLSQTIAQLQVKVGYMAPEALGNGNDPKSPYWSLGMICYQLLTGHPVSAGRDDNAFRIVLATTDIDVSAIVDPNWRALVEGLLTRNTRDRWGAEHVRQWMNGKAPRTRRVTTAHRAATSITFAGERFDDPRLLAIAMTQDCDRAATWLKDKGAGQLQQWLDTSFPDQPYERTNLLGVNRNDSLAHVAVTRFAATYLPDQRPHYRGQPVDETGLLRLARTERAWLMLGEVLRMHVLQVAARHDCGHPKCSGGAGCQVLSALDGRIPMATAIAAQTLTRLRTRLASDEVAELALNALMSGAWDENRLQARAFEYALSDIARSNLKRQLGQSPPRAAWWREVSSAATSADHLSEHGLAALLVAAELVDAAEAYRRAQDRLRRSQIGAGITRTWRVVLNQFRRQPSGGHRRFTTPTWISRTMWWVMPFSTVEPVYLAVAQAQGIHGNPDIMQTAQQAVKAVAPYTEWSSDWLTPLLATHWQTDPTHLYAAYPIALALSLIVIRRSRGGSAARSWTALPATVVGLVFTVGFVMQLLAQNFSILWLGLATLWIGMFIAPLACIAAVRVLGGRA